MSLFSFGFKKVDAGAAVSSSSSSSATSSSATKLKGKFDEREKKRVKVVESDSDDDAVIVIKAQKPEKEVEVMNNAGTRKRTKAPKGKQIKRKKLVKGGSKKQTVLESDSSSSEDYEDDGDSDASFSSSDDDEDSDGDVKMKSKSKQKKQEPSTKAKQWVKPKFKTPSKPKAAARPKVTPNTAISTPKTTPPPSGGEKAGVLGAGEHVHHHLVWLNEEREDLKGRNRKHPDFDETTLKIPKGYFNGKIARLHGPSGPKKITPAIEVWWDFKKRNMDTILFFKVGKFYELYHMDADVMVRNVGLKYMRGDFAHCGFPEKAYAKFSEELVVRGYRVGRVEQTESVEAMRARTSKKSGMVRRELCGVTSRGTRLLGNRNVDKSDLGSINDSAVELLCLYETGNCEFGVCILDSTVGSFSVGSFKDKSNLCGLRMLLSRENIAEIVYARGTISANALQMIQTLKPQVLGVKGTNVHSQVVGASSTMDEEVAFVTSTLDEDLMKLLNTAANSDKIALSAFGVCLRYLKRGLIDDELLSMKLFHRYVMPGTASPNSVPASSSSSSSALAAVDIHKEMVMDGQALSNLEVFQNESDGVKGSLIEYLDKTVTKFGSRLLRRWVKGPLQSKQAILKRQECVTALVKLADSSDVFKNCRVLFKKVIDLERMLMRIHSMGLKKSKDHPDSRAVLYEGQLYNKTKIVSLVKTLEGMEMIQDALLQFGQELSGKPEFDCLNHLSIMSDGSGGCPDLSTHLQFFRKSFDETKALRLGQILPNPGYSPSFDDAQTSLAQVKQELEQELESACSVLQKNNKLVKKPRLKFWPGGQAKARYQIEVPDELLGSIRAPNSWKLKSKKKGLRRFHTPTIIDLLDKLSLAEQVLEQESCDQTRLVFARFDEKREMWSKALSCAAELDCLMSLALVSGDSSEGSPMCAPDIVDDDGTSPPVLYVEDSRHPCVAASLEESGKSFISNTITVGGPGDANCMLLTGPNMGGKSTLLRQACVLVVMAQIGCYVPAKSCRVTPVDRIFTRLGATDKIMMGQSTFFVELDETATVLNNATSRSLVILDELGRGTSTFDGTAIAYAVVDKLCQDSLRCRTIFATHYHSLVEEFQGNDNVKVAHMSCFVENDDKKKHEDVTFLYRLADGASDKSHGLNVARLAGLPESIVSRAKTESERFERNFAVEQLVTQLRDAVENDQGDVLLGLWEKAKMLSSSSTN